jgi:oxepin-CoA hydrolase/3-oxo-5,6-dehydrosuberyl-CoA semialdehyde dehydrogenase
MNQPKLNFLSTEFIPLLDNLPAEAAGKWGKMNGQQMVEHVSGFFKVSTGKIKFPLVTPAEHLPKYKEFLLSEKEFRENTKAPVLPEEPLAVRFADMPEAINDLDIEIKEFIRLFSNNEQLTVMHPVFGELNFDEWVLLHYKHVRHHLRQFGL